MTGRSLVRSLLIASMFGLLPSCNLLQSGQEGVHGERDLARLEQEILAEIGDAEAAHVRQCRTIAFGSKPCGGPWRYLVYSREAANEERLKDLVAVYNDEQQRLNDQEGLISDCMLVTRPDTTLVDGQCRAR